jgi:hypothetical protein
MLQTILIRLFFILQSVLSKPPNPPVVAECMLILKALMNTPAGLKAVVETQVTYKLVIASIANCGISSESAQNGTRFFFLFLFFGLCSERERSVPNAAIFFLSLETLHTIYRPNFLVAFIVSQF